MADLTTIQISKEARENLRRLADFDLRSSPSEFEWLINQELARRGMQTSFEANPSGCTQSNISETK
jgi:hypothetical protein